MNIRTQLNWQALCLATLLLLGSSIPGTAIRQNQSPKPQVANQTNEALAEKQALRKRNFEPFARLLRSKQVPFEPEMLLENNWPKKLAPIFDQMPEMQEARYRAEPLAGVQLADTLYLPERVEIVADTIILVRHLVFEGAEAVIKGNYHIALYPANDVRFLGTTLLRSPMRSVASGSILERMAKWSGVPGHSKGPMMLGWRWTEMAMAGSTTAWSCLATSPSSHPPTSPMAFSLSLSSTPQPMVGMETATSMPAIRSTHS
jgi:hypothetical protein